MSTLLPIIMTEYLVLSSLAMTANAVGAFVGGIFFKKLTNAIKIIVVLAVFGALWDVFALMLVMNNQIVSRVWLSVVAAPQFFLVLWALMHVGNDIFTGYVHGLLRISLFVYPLIFCGLYWFVPELFLTPFITIGTYFFLAFIVGECLVEMYRHNALFSNQAEFWVLLALFGYYVCVVALLCLKLTTPKMNPNYYWTPHALLAVLKNGLLIYSFNLKAKSWNSKAL